MALMFVNEWPTVEATSDGATLTIKSGAEELAFFLTPYATLGLQEVLRREGWPVRCAPDGELVRLPKPHARRAKP